MRFVGIFLFLCAAFAATLALWLKFGGLVFIETALAKVALCF